MTSGFAFFAAGPLARDSAYAAGLGTTLRLMAHHFASREDAAALVTLLATLPEANPVLASGVITGIAGGPPDSEGRQRGGPGGWPEGSVPVLTAEQRTSLAGLAARVTPEVAEGLERVAARWEMPGLFGTQ